MIEHEFSLPDRSSWIVQGFEFSSEEESRAVREKIVEESKGTEGNFSIWRTTNPERTRWLVVLCAKREHLPVIDGGTPYEFSREEAQQFALRRARVGQDAYDSGARGHIEQEVTYNQDVTIDSATGNIKPYRQH